MSHSTAPSFAKRSRTISRSHQAISRKGAEFEIGPDGLLTVRPRRQGLRFIPVRGLVILALVLMVGKALMLAHVGAQTYGDRLDRLTGGNTGEKVGAFILQADPLTIALAGYFQPLIK